MKRQAIDFLDGRTRNGVFRAGDVTGLPTHRSLLLQNRQGSERITALQWYRMIEDVQDAHGRRGQQIDPGPCRYLPGRLPMDSDDLELAIPHGPKRVYLGCTI